MVNDKQLNAWFVSSKPFSADDETKAKFREMAKAAAQDYLKEARKVPKAGSAEAFAIWPEVLPIEGPLQPLDAFEQND